MANDPNAPPPRGPKSGDSDPAPEERPTMVPQFDVESFARESDQMAAATPVPPPQEEATPESQTTLDDIRGRMTAGDFEGALQGAERLLQATPLHVEASRLASACKTAWEEAIIDRLGDLARVPVVAVRAGTLRELGLDAHEGFVVAQIDGVSSIETLVDICTMPRLSILRVLERLVGAGVIKLA